LTGPPSGSASALPKNVFRARNARLLGGPIKSGHDNLVFVDRILAAVICDFPSGPVEEKL
jgi:hypothetical protein